MSLRRQVLNRVAPVWCHNLAAFQLLVGVRRVGDLLLSILNNGQSGETVARTELTRPASGDGERSADNNECAELAVVYEQLLLGRDRI